MTGVTVKLKTRLKHRIKVPVDSG
ncbi:hypothetical protein ACOJUR_08830 [Alicyclobacillus tolerans]